MDAQQKFSDLYTELQKEVVVLDRKKIGLITKLTTLEAKEAFLRGSVTNLDKRSKEALKKHTEAEEKRQEELGALDDTIDDVKKYVKDLESSKKVAEAELISLQNTHDKKIVQFDKTCKAKQNEAMALDDRISAKKMELREVENRIYASSEKLETINNTVEAKKLSTQEFMDDIAARESEVNKQYQLTIGKFDDKQDELEELEKKIDGRKKVIIESEKKQQDFLDYEKRATTALESRESALLEGEKELERNTILARRRHGVLDKV